MRIFSNEIHAFLWTRQNGMIDLGTLGGPHSHASEINERGQVVGRSDREFVESEGAWRTHGVLWKDGAMIDLGSLNPDEDSYAFGINGRGQIVGSSGSQAVMWSPSKRSKGGCG